MNSKHPLLSRLLFMLPAAAAAVPLMMVLICSVSPVDPLATLAIVGSGLIGAVLVIAAPPVHRFERFLAAHLFGTELADESSPGAYRRAAVFSGFHLLTGLAVMLSLWAVPFAVSEFAWRTERILTGEVAPTAIIGFYLEGLMSSEVRIFLALILIGSVLVVTSYVVMLPQVARQLLGVSLETKLADSEAERHRLEALNDLARDIHDSLGHTLTIASLQAERGRAQLSDDPAATDDALDTILLVCRRAQADLDDVLRVLRTGELRAESQVRDLRSIGDLIDGARSAGLIVDVDIPLNLDLLADRAQALYRIIQEALTNALRHSSPKKLSLSVIEEADRGLRIRAQNPIEGQTEHHPGRGLLGIDARAQLLGGQASSQMNGEEFVLVVEIPASEVTA